MTNPDLPPLPIWQAKSFWYALLMALAAIWTGIDQAATTLGWNFPDWMLAGQEETLAGAIASIIAPIVVLLSGLGAYRERMNPHRRLTLSASAPPAPPGSRPVAGSTSVDRY